MSARVAHTYSQLQAKRSVELTTHCACFRSYSGLTCGQRNCIAVGGYYIYPSRSETTTFTGTTHSLLLRADFAWRRQDHPWTLCVGTKTTFRRLVIRKDTHDDILREFANSPLKYSAIRYIRFLLTKDYPRRGHTTVNENQHGAILVHLTKLRHVPIHSQNWDVDTLHD
ncbi:hypothetical protein BC835DRAFT_359714 [Cytidiella melzeri]|nr:hypothetical protein BC835DRAFT_359714 [Cytidiella melzeri]